MPSKPSLGLGASGPAGIVETDALLRLHVVAAAWELGFASAAAEPGGCGVGVVPATVFVGLDTAAACPRCGTVAPRPGSAGPPLLVGYATEGRELLAAHRLHACCDVVLELHAVAGKACFAHVPTGGAVEQALLTTREADVLVLVLDGLSNAALAERLCVSPATARTHCRALLRKFGAADRRALRARLLGAEAGASRASAEIALESPPRRFAQPTPRSLPRYRA